jgi:iron complex transport system ATP-binding protein
MLRCEHLGVAVPGRVLVPGLDFEVKRGEVWAVLGPNGSGKTTLMHTLAGLLPSQGGTIAYDGTAPAGLAGAARAGLIGILLQHEDAEFWGSVHEYVRLGRFARSSGWFAWGREDEEAAREALARVALADFGARAYRTLSGGERQRARLAQLVAQDPQVLLLDEPLQHLDLRHQVEILRLIDGLARLRGRAVVMVLHDAQWPVRFCTHALLVHDDGAAAAGPAADLLTRERLERLYGCPLTQLGEGRERVYLPVI